MSKEPGECDVNKTHGGLLNCASDVTGGSYAERGPRPTEPTHGSSPQILHEMGGFSGTAPKTTGQDESHGGVARDGQIMTIPGEGLDEVIAPPPVPDPDDGELKGTFFMEDQRTGTQGHPVEQSYGRSPAGGGADYSDQDLPEASERGLDEVMDPAPVQNTDDAEVYHVTSLEGSRTRERQHDEEEQRRASLHRTPKEIVSPSRRPAEVATISYLVFFSILGTLARLGLQALTVYPGAPVVFGVIWTNFAGCIVMGFLAEDRMLFRRILPTHKQFSPAAKDDQDSVEQKRDIDYTAAKKAHNAAKKTTPLYIGLATGFCGSFTSFSSFIQDVYLALSNRLPTPVNHPYPSAGGDVEATTVARNGGYSFMALLAVIFLTMSLSISGLILGAHLAIGLERFSPRLSPNLIRRLLDRSIAFIAAGCWLGAVLLSIFPPDRHTGGPEIWRGRATFALVFAPPGVLTRFYISLWLNGKFISFPLGTFVVNVFGTAVLGICYDLQHVPLGGVVGCQVLQGVQDGYCGCVTTVSTWVSELVSLRKRHAYRYGIASVVVGLAFLVVIMGSMQWTRGFEPIICAT